MTIRPKTITFRGGVVNISVHDAWFCRMVQAYRATVQSYHPDIDTVGRNKSTTGYRFMESQQRYKEFLTSETYWYAEFGLKPPKVPRVKLDRTKPTRVASRRYPNRRPTADASAIEASLYSESGAHGRYIGLRTAKRKQRNPEPMKALRGGQ